ncbi:MAG: hypothetical protein AAFO06_00420 [Cyanobacteria bacterium J06597_16]
MTSQQDQIQSLIADIERALGQEKPRKPWVRSSEMESQRQALSQAQTYLKSLQEAFDAPGGWGPVDPSTGQLVNQSGGDQLEGRYGAVHSAEHSSEESAENVLQALLTEMKFLKSSALEPLRLEMESLREERDSLQGEVTALSEERTATLKAMESDSQAIAGEAPSVASQQPTVTESQLNEFLQALMERLQERLSVQVSETLTQLESDHAEAVNKLSASAGEQMLQLQPSGQIEELRQLQSRSDQLLVNIDSTLQGMFETLQKNIDSYQLSLNEGIENMHSLGRQGEVIVRSLVDHLTQQLGQTAPPEPAFYPQRSAALIEDFAETPLALADTAANETAEVASAEVAGAADMGAADPAIGETAGPEAVEMTNESLPREAETLASDSASSEILTEASSDTVSSLDEILPEISAETDLAADGETELQPEDCIKEDGTIDLDLLKLDIDRSEDDATVSRDELMIDAAIADAQVAATEAEDADIEAKVTPTPEAAYLADLTLDDLVKDDADSDTSFAEGQASSTATESQPGSQTPNFHTAEETELSAILPDLGEPATALGENSELSSLEASGEAPDLDAPDLDAPDLDVQTAADESAYSTEGKPESAAIPDIPDADEDADVEAQEDVEDIPPPDDLVAEIEAENQVAQQVAVESVDEDLNALQPDLEEPVVFEAAAPQPQTLVDEAEPLDSAFIPDRPQDEDADSPNADSPEDVDSPDTQKTDGSQEISASEPSLEPSGNEMAALAADLPADLPIDLAQDISGDSFEASLQALEDDFEETDPLSELDSVLEESDSFAQEASDQAFPEQIDPPLPPVDFDDDLDFYSDASDAGSSEDSPEGEAAESEPSAQDQGGISQQASESSVSQVGQQADYAQQSLETVATASEADTTESAGELPVLIAPPLEALAAPLATDDIEATEAIGEAAADPYATADLERPSDIENIFDDGDDGDDDPTDGQPANWFLGIDLGTTGLSAVLMNQLGDQVYPLCWTIAGDDEANRFRLPAVAQVESQHPQQVGQLGAVGPAVLQSTDEYLRAIKPLLKIGIPHGTSGEPWVQWSDQVAVPLITVQSALSQLLTTLSADRMSCRAVGLKSTALKRILNDLKGVVVGYPNNWPDTYSFNIREAILAAGLVQNDDQVVFIDEAIAALLSALPDPQVETEDLDEQQPGLYNCNWSGGTVVISAGSTLTEAAIVDLPAELDQLQYSDFVLRSFTYAGDSLDQDIVIQLMHLPVQAAIDNQAMSGVADAMTNSWQSLGLDQLPLPQPGEADRVKRHRLRQRLNSSPMGRQALAAARELKLALQEDNEYDLTLADQVWTINRKDLETKVFLPYIQRINRQVNGLLSQKGMSTQAVKQVVCTGGSASLGAIARWLRQKFPNATIIQDTYSGEYSNSCSRVAYGLANLCNYPTVFDANRHQYNDYFLLLELLRILPDQPLPAGGILHLLEERGVNTQACQSHILALIEGHLPPGLVPTEGDRPMISAQSPGISEYRALAEMPLFKKQGGQIYIADYEQGQRLRSHLESILDTKVQKLSEPLTVQLTAESV